jgi:hypothetical protein
MTMRQATVLVSEDLTYALNGKMNIQGVFTTDIGIPFEPYLASQLVFVFLVETTPDDPYKTLELSVELPGGQQNLRQPIMVRTLRPSAGDQLRWSLKYPLLFSGPILRPGPIIAKVIHDKGEISAATPSIVLNVPPKPPTSSSEPSILP